MEEETRLSIQVETNKSEASLYWRTLGNSIIENTREEKIG